MEVETRESGDLAQPPAVELAFDVLLDER
jgi:hypothetical protein